jgi:hypothetical protein
VSLHRRAARRDKSEGPIFASLRAHGFSVQPLSIKNGPDAAIGRHGISRLIECKTDDEPLRDNQVEWWALWRGNACIVLRSVDQVPALAKYWALLDSNLLALLESK